jgi:hypothetical protein
MPSGTKQDLEERNFVTNWLYITEPLLAALPGIRRKLCLEGDLAFAVIDFDCSIMVPMNSSLRDCRLPAIRAHSGALIQPYDVSQGEIDYNPFAFDVGILGMTFCRQFQVRRPHIGFAMSHSSQSLLLATDVKSAHASSPAR